MASPSFTPRTFPGVYTQIIDRSFITPRTSRYKPGLIGVASKGPFNTPTVIQSLRDFVQTFGNPIATTYITNSAGASVPGSGNTENSGYFLADAVDAVADFSNAITVVRIGKTLTAFPDSDGSGTAGSYTLGTPLNAARVNSLQVQGSVYLSVKQAGMPSTVNALVTAAGGGTVSLSNTTEALQANYSAAQVSYSIGSPAANQAESVLYAYSYGSNSSSITDYGLSTYGAVTGNKNDFSFNVAANAGAITAGDVFKIKQTGKATTHEIRVASRIVNADGSGVVYAEKVGNQQIGYSAVPLQDNYTSATLYKATGKQALFYLKAASEGTWANGTVSTQGLYTKVRPGSGPGTKKLEVYWNSSLVETHDNLTDTVGDANYWTTRLAKGISNYVYIEYGVDLGQNWTAANTVNPWDARFYVAGTVGSIVAMPVGAVNAGNLTITGTVTNTGGQFLEGYNGENATAADWIGTLDPATDKLTGLRAFENRRNTTVNVIAIPQHNVSLDVLQQLASTCRAINAIGISDVPAGLNGRQAIDWHNGLLPSQTGARLDSFSVEILWNWGQRTNRFGETKLVPPSVFWLGRAGYTFNAYSPWFAIAGEKRGYLQDCQKVQYVDVSENTLQAMYGNGNSVNPILSIDGSFYIYGERTMQRAESRLTGAHSVICVNYIVTGMSDVSRQYVFDPNDAELLDTLKLGYTELLEKIKNDRGIEVYELSVTASAENRNNREVIVNLSVVTTEIAEKIYINATVRESGAITVNSVA